MSLSFCALLPDVCFLLIIQNYLVNYLWCALPILYMKILFLFGGTIDNNICYQWYKMEEPNTKPNSSTYRTVYQQILFHFTRPSYHKRIMEEKFRSNNYLLPR